MKSGEIYALLVAIMTAIYELLSIGIISNVIFEELQWILVDMNKIFHEYGSSQYLVQIMASILGLILAIGYQLVSVEITIVWANFVYSKWGIIGYYQYTPHLIILLSLVIYFCASFWLRSPIKKKLHVTEPRIH